MSEMFGETVHAARIRSLSSGVLGVLSAGVLGVRAIGRGLAAARGLVDKHAIKQIDRLLSNEELGIWVLAAVWVPAVIGSAERVFINLDWTDADGEDHTTLMASLQTEHGRSAPLLWKTHRKSQLAGHRAEYEDELLERLHEVVPDDVHVTIVADRGFADQLLYRMIVEMGWNYIIRFKKNILVRSADGEQKPASAWLGRGGRMRVLRQAFVTGDDMAVGSVVVVQDRGMKDIWCLAVGDAEMTGSEVKRRYGRRFSCEETFRDLKDPRFGMGLSHCAVTIPARRDMLLLLAVIAQRLLTLLGEAGERAGLDRLLKADTSKKRSLSLLRQGLRWYDLMPRMPEARLRVLIESFEAVLAEHPGMLHLLHAVASEAA
jgi:hypothetical protein